MSPSHVECAARFLGAHPLALIKATIWMAAVGMKPVRSASSCLHEANRKQLPRQQQQLACRRPFCCQANIEGQGLRCTLLHRPWPGQAEL